MAAPGYSLESGLAGFTARRSEADVSAIAVVAGGRLLRAVPRLFSANLVRLHNKIKKRLGDGFPLPRSQGLRIPARVLYGLQV